MTLIDGKKIAADIVARLKALPKPKGFFGAVLVGDDPASLNFLKQKEKVALELGIDFRLYRLDEALSTDDLRHEIGRLANQKPCGALIVQLPFPEALNKNRHYVMNAIPIKKDPDVLSEAALGAFYTGRSPIVPPSVGVVEEILRLEDCQGCVPRELRVVVIGAGFLIGKPVGFWLQNHVAELTVLDEHVEDLKPHLRRADVVISGTGHAHLFSAADLKDGALVIDFGYNVAQAPPQINADDTQINTDTKKIFGDFNPRSTFHASRSTSYTPTPGGTGPILVAKLFENFYKLSKGYE